MDCGYFVPNMHCDLTVPCTKDTCRKECIDGMFEKKKPFYLIFAHIFVHVVMVIYFKQCNK